MFLVNVSGTIKSPNYPQPYDRPSTCSWFLNSYPGQLITIRVVDFNLPPAVNSICRDFVHFSAGVEPEEPIFGRDNYCGSTIPAINLVDRGIFIQFDASSSSNISGYRGFQINYAPCKYQIASHFTV